MVLLSSWVYSPKVGLSCKLRSKLSRDLNLLVLISRWFYQHWFYEAASTVLDNLSLSSPVYLWLQHELTFQWKRFLFMFQVYFKYFNLWEVSDFSGSFQFRHMMHLLSCFQRLFLKSLELQRFKLFYRSHLKFQWRKSKNWIFQSLLSAVSGETPCIN